MPRYQLWVNGERRQASSTSYLIFPIDHLIEFVTFVMTLEPGDIISTGTPAGVGMAMDPPHWLVAGDTVRIEIESIGVLENPVIPEPADTPSF